MTIGRITDRIRRAQRNRTGANFSLEDLKLLAGSGALHRLALQEVDEMCRSVDVEPPIWDLKLERPAPKDPAK